MITQRCPHARHLAPGKRRAIPINDGGHNSTSIRSIRGVGVAIYGSLSQTAIDRVVAYLATLADVPSDVHAERDGHLWTCGQRYLGQVAGITDGYAADEDLWWWDVASGQPPHRPRARYDWSTRRWIDAVP